jgi:hypothetical protein
MKEMMQYFYHAGMRKNPKGPLVFANEELKRGVDHVGVSLTQHA